MHSTCFRKNMDQARNTSYLTHLPFLKVVKLCTPSTISSTNMPFQAYFPLTPYMNFFFPSKILPRFFVDSQIHLGLVFSSPCPSIRILPKLHRPSQMHMFHETITVYSATIWINRLVSIMCQIEILSILLSKYV